jgi:acyl-CoA synthetase (NDP forming)/RimJ/RimL family protein N-acetyltransferase
MATRPAVDVALRDGSSVHVRPVEPADVEALETFLEGLSPESRWFRFFSAGADLHEMARWSAGADGTEGDGLVVTAGRDGPVVGHARYTLLGADSAEIAFATDDAWHGRGIATILLAHLAQTASARGIHEFVATVLPENHKMIGVFRDSGFAVSVRSAPDALEIVMPTELDEAGRARFADRDRRAAVSAMAHVLRPSSVVVVGASRRAGSVGRDVLDGLLAGGFTGAVHPVNPRADEIAGIRAHRRVGDVGEPVDLALLAVPAEAVCGVARECAAAGVRALVVLSAGFAERGETGRARQEELLRICRDGGMRLVGPNCLGVINTDPAVRLTAMLGAPAPPPGTIAFASQSGAFGITALEQARARALGISSFVSLGNKADLSGNDVLQFWEQDDRTEVVLLYLESVGNPRRFGAIARRLATGKPVAIVKSARTAAGRRASASHTGALLAASEDKVDALFAHAGVIRTETLAELFDVAAVLADQPLPGGRRVGIVTNAGGPGTVCADACVSAGLRVEPLAASTRERLLAILPADATPANPVGLDAPARPQEFRATVEALADDLALDALIVIFARPMDADPAAVAAAIRDGAHVARERGKPVLVVDLGRHGARPELESDAGRVPSFAAPEEAARALGHVAAHARRRARGPDEPPALEGIDSDGAAAVVARRLAAGGGWLPPADADALLRAYGVPVLWSRVVSSPRAAGHAAAEHGGPVAVKAVAPDVPRKADAGAVVLDVRGRTAAERAAREVAAALAGLGHVAEGFVVQAMAEPGIEMLVGVTADDRFGALVACGAGGRALELLGDVEVRLAPLSRREAAEMVRGLRMYGVLTDRRGGPPADVAALEDVVVRIAALAAAHPEIAEVDGNPVIVSAAGAAVADSRVRLAPPPAAEPFAALQT